jgi:predicted nucleic acid-binding Zn ribbon protein
LDDPAPIRAAIAEVAAGLGVEQPLETARIFNCWETVVGVELASRCRPTSLRGGVLRVRMESAVWASEIRYLADEIIKRVNRAVGSNVVHEIKPWVASRREELPPQDRTGGRAATTGGQRNQAPALGDAAVGREIEDQALASALKRAFKAAQKTGK